MKIRDLFPNASFRLEGVCYTIRKFDNGMAWCEGEDGALAILHEYTVVDKWQPRRSFGQWLRQFAP